MLSQSDFLRHLSKALDGNPESEKAIYQGYVGFAFNLAKKYCSCDDDAADVAQEAMITAFEKLSNYNPSKGDFKSYLAKITVHKALRWNSKTKFKIPLEEYVQLERSINDEHVAVSQIGDIIDSLNTEQRNLYELYFQSGFSHAEISEVLKITVANSRIKLFRFVKDLKEKYT